VKAACDALGTNLQADDLASWIEADDETPVAQRLSEEDIAASVKNGKTTAERGASDTGSDSEDNGDDSCCAVCTFSLEVTIYVDRTLSMRILPSFTPTPS
jgi:hypothetical protein